MKSESGLHPFLASPTKKKCHKATQNWNAAQPSNLLAHYYHYQYKITLPWSDSVGRTKGKL